MNIPNKVFFVGPLPPPVHGFAVINEKMLEKLRLEGDVNVFDIAPRNGILSYFKIMFLFVKFCVCLAWDRNGSLYLPLSGGYRQFIDICFALVAKLFGLRVFVHHHSFAYLNEHQLYAKIIFKLLGKSSHIVLCERMGAMLKKKYGLVNVTTTVVSNAVFLESKVIKPSLRDCSSGKLVVGYLSNISREKGGFDFIHLIEKANANGLCVEGLMAGPIQSDIEQRFLKSVEKVDGLKCIGPVYNADKEKFYSQIDVLVFPTRYINEAEPVTIWEAMQAGVPVISYARGCIECVVTQDVGWVIHDLDDSLNLGVSYLRALIDDDQLLLTMKQAARDKFIKSHQTYENNLNAIVNEMYGRSE